MLVYIRFKYLTRPFVSFDFYFGILTPSTRIDIGKDDTDTTESNSPTTATPNKTASDRAANTNTKKSNQRVYVAGKMRREKSLSILSRKFIQMFLEGKVRDLDVCARTCVSSCFLFFKNKTRVRCRCYVEKMSSRWRPWRRQCWRPLPKAWLRTVQKSKVRAECLK